MAKFQHLSSQPRQKRTIYLIIIGRYHYCHVLKKEKYNFLIKYNILYKSQYGFGLKHSTINAATELCYNIVNSFENNQCTLAVYLDLSKAFDTINHQTLLNKLAQYGVRGVALEWLSNYLKNRKQYVEYKNCRSQTQEIFVESHRDQFLVHYCS